MSEVASWRLVLALRALAYMGHDRAGECVEVADELEAAEVLSAPTGEVMERAAALLALCRAERGGGGKKGLDELKGGA